MEESELALSAAAECAPKRESQTVRRVLEDPVLHRLWEARHAELVRPVAQLSRRAPQVLALRNVEAGLLHRRALIDYIRRNKLRDAERDRLFQLFYGPRDAVGAIVSEHRQYMLAVSSRISTDHLIRLMHDEVSLRLLNLYESVYREYFELYCLYASADDPFLADALKADVQKARMHAENVRARLVSAKPDRRYSDFDRQALLARSGRYPILNYMVG